MKRKRKSGDEQLPATRLRRRAERQLGKPGAKPAVDLAGADVGALIHELQVHRIELEMQNEDLHRARTVAEDLSRKYIALFDFAPTGYFLWDERATIREVNLAGAALLGLDRTAVIEKRFGQFVVLKDRHAFTDFCKRAIVADTKQICQVGLLNGEEVVEALIEGVAVATPERTGRLCRASVIDITEQKQTETKLKHSEETSRHLANVVESCDDAIITKDLNGIIRSWNKGAEKVFGYRADEMIGQSINRLLQPDRIFEENALLDKLQRGETVERFETVRLHKNGKLIEISATVSLIRDIDGRVTGASKIAQDITTGKQAERRARELFAEVTHLGRLKSMGEMVAGVAHEIGQPLHAIKNYGSACRNALTKTPVGPNSQLAGWLEQIDRAAGIASEVLMRLRKYARSQTTEHGPVELNAVLREVIDILKFDAMRSQVVIEWQPKPAQILVTADRVQIYQILINLAQNAVESMSSVPNDLRIVRLQLSSDGAHAVVEVIDSGVGIPLNSGRSVFDPFVTTKPNGLGLGLSISKSLAEAHGGELGYRPNPQGGTVFSLRLPLIRDQREYNS